jgi:stage V sporulation protein AB
MWVRQIVLALVGLSSGIVAAGGLFSFIAELGVVSDFADRTHTGEQIRLYESCISAGGILGNLIFVFQIPIPAGRLLVPIFGLFAGIFVGCWAMALAEVLNLFPVFVRRAKVFKPIPWIILSLALGKSIGSLLFFFQRW